MSLCNKEITKRPYNSGVPITELNKDYGLNIIFNVKSDVTVCEEVFVGPTINTNLTKIQTGLTETSIGVFNLSDFAGGNVPFEYEFTGNTSVLTGYTGDFVYEIYPRTTELEIPEIIGISGNVPLQPIFSRELFYREETPFSDLLTPIPGAPSINLNLIPNLVSDQEWILNYTYNFDRQNCINKNKYFGETIKNEYDETQTFYFVTLSNPSDINLGPFPEPPPTTPEILTVNRRERPLSDPSDTYVFGVPIKLDEEKNECRLRVETLPISLPNTTIFTVNGIPVPNSLMVSVNGVTLSPDDYTVSNNTVLTLVQPLFPSKDIITATYIECEEQFDVIYSEQYEILTGITSGVTSGVTVDDKVYFNTDQGKYEYYTDFTTEEPENILLYLNGVKLTYGLDFYLSVTVPNRIIFDSIQLTLTDIIYLVYITDGLPPGDYGLITYDNQLEWVTDQPPVVNNRVNGKFIVEITDTTDISFTSLNKVQLEVDYEDGNPSYSVGIPINTLQSNQKYIWRVISEKYYNGLVGNIFTTENISVTGKFYTNNLINSY